MTSYNNKKTQQQQQQQQQPRYRIIKINDHDKGIKCQGAIAIYSNDSALSLFLIM